MSSLTTCHAEEVLAAQQDGLDQTSLTFESCAGCAAAGKAQADAAAVAGVKVLVFSTLEDVDKRSNVRPAPALTMLLLTLALPDVTTLSMVDATTFSVIPCLSSDHQPPVCSTNAQDVALPSAGVHGHTGGLVHT